MKRSAKLYLIITLILFVLTVLAVFTKNRFVVDGLFAAMVYFVVSLVFRRFSWAGISAVSYLLILCAAVYVAFAYFPQQPMLIKLYSAISSSNISADLTNISMLIYSVSITLCSALDILLSRTEKSINSLIYSVCVGLLLMLISYFSLSTQITIVRYDISLPNLPPELEGLKIAHLSDTHSTLYPPDNSLAELIKKESPDLILHTGDMAEEYMPYKGTEILLNEIENIAPLYYSIGNHEYWSPDFWQVNANIKKHKITVLENKTAIIDINGQKLLLAGLNDPDEAPVTKNTLSSEEKLAQMYVPFDGVKILLSHRPDLVDVYKKSDYDIVLSGHAHGGQVQIPFVLNGLFAPNQGFFPKYAGGLYELDSNNPTKTKLIVSRGLAIQSMPRVFNPPELVIITLNNSY